VSRGHSLAVAPLLIAATVFVYARALNSPFQFDDEAGILLNPSIQNLRDIAAIVSYKPELPRPLFNLSLAIDYRLFGFSQFGYHLTNLIIHLIGVLLVWWLASEVNHCVGAGARSSLQPAIAAFVFALHPIATEPTLYIWSRSSSMMTVFSLASVTMYLTAQRKERRAIWLAGSLAAFGLAVLSKEEAITLPLLILACDWVLLPREGRRLKVLMLFWAVPLVALVYRLASRVTLYDVISWRVTEGDEFSEIVAHSTMAKIALVNLLTQMKVGLYYALMLFFPINQSVDHGAPFEVGTPGAAVYAGIIFTFIVVAIFFFGRRRAPRAALAAAFFIAPLSIFYVIPVSDAMVERRLYLPLAGFAIWLSAALGRICHLRFSIEGFPPMNRGKIQSRYIEIKSKIVCVLPLVLFGALTFNRAKMWEDRIALWSDAVKVSPDKLRPHAVLARYLYESGHVRSAIQENLTAIHMKENYGPPTVNLGLIYLDMGDLLTAEKYFRQAVHWRPGADFSARYNLAVTLDRMGRYEEARDEFLKTIRINRGHALARAELGRLLAEQGRLEEAEGWLREALSINPALSMARMNLGKVLINMGRKEEGIRQLELAVTEAPDEGLIWYNLGTAYLGDGRLEKAEWAFRNGMKDSRRPEAIFGMAQVRIRQNRNEEAISLLRAFLASVNLHRRPELAPMVERAQRSL